MATFRGARLPLGAEVALAFASGLAVFTALAIPLAVADSRVILVVLFSLVGVAAVIGMFRFLGVAYAVPAAVAGLLAFDWFYIQPTHPHAFPSAQSLADLFVSLAVGVLIGQLAAGSFRRAAVSEVARSALADEQAALRRVATLVAEGVPANRLLAAVAEEAASLLDVDGAWIEFYEGEEVVTAAEWSRPGKDPPTFDRVKVKDAPVAAAVRRSGGVVRIDDFESIQPKTAFAEKPRVMSLVGAPITVEKGQWGLMLAWSRDRPLPDDAEVNLTAFTELVATAIANSDARAEVQRLADEQAALRRVATLVARGAPPEEVFAAVAQEVGQLLGVDFTHLGRYRSDRTSIGVASWSADGSHLPMGTVAPLDGVSITGMVYESGRPERLDSYEGTSGEIAEISEKIGVRSSVGAPIIVDGRPWGVMVVSSKEPYSLPAETESRLAAFTGLAATAISNTESRNETRRLGEEQAALRRVATLVASDVPSDELFAAVARELAELLNCDSAHVLHYEEGHTAVKVVGAWAGEAGTLPVGLVAPLRGRSVSQMVLESRRAVRFEDYHEAGDEIGRIASEYGIRSSAGAPIVVGGRLWGTLVASSHRPERLPPDTEARLGEFTALVATAISNTESRQDTRRLAEEQAALRRVATLVAEDVPPEELFLAVVEEVGTLFRTNLATLLRYEDENTATLVSTWTADGVPLEGQRTWSMTEMGLTRTLARNNWPTRVDDWNQFSGPLAEYVRDVGVTSSVGSPIIVEGQLWGALAVHSTQEEPVPVGAELRLGQFTELAATAIANSQARSDLAASRARIVAAEDEERRRVVRDLHDGAQQRLVHTVVTLNMASSALEAERDDAARLVSEALRHAEEATGELRELAHGILPSVLTQGGLRAGVAALASRMPVPVENGVSVDRLPPDVEATAYFIVAEALTNVAKHAHASHAVVTARTENGALHIQVRDDGVGGAQSGGPGLVGVADRVSAIDGTLRLESPADGGTLLAAQIPVLHRD